MTSPTDPCALCKVTREQHNKSGRRGLHRFVEPSDPCARTLEEIAHELHMALGNDHEGYRPLQDRDEALILAALRSAVEARDCEWQDAFGCAADPEVVRAEYDKREANWLMEMHRYATEAQRKRDARICANAYGPWDASLPPEQNVRAMGKALAAAIRGGADAEE